MLAFTLTQADNSRNLSKIIFSFLHQDNTHTVKYKILIPYIDMPKILSDLIISAECLQDHSFHIPKTLATGKEPQVTAA